MSLFGRPAKENKAPTEQQSSSFGKGQSSSQLSKSLAPSQPAPPRIEPKKISPPAQKPSMSQKPAPAQKPKTLFEEKKDWKRQEFLNQAAKNPFSSGGKMYSFYERKKMLEKTFSPGRFSTYISEGEAKTRLRELRSEEYRAKTYVEKSKLAGMRKYLEGQTGLKGKY